MSNAKSIWKFPFMIDDEIEIEMPAGSQVLHVECQQGQPCMWVLVDSEMTKATRRFRIVGTGHLFMPPGPHIGSFQMASGNLVWHVFEAP